MRDAGGSVKTSSHEGLSFSRFFTQENFHPYDQVKWEKRTARITGDKGEVIFEQEVEFPDFWSDTAVQIVASKYFRGQLGTPEREYSLKQLIERVVNTITLWGIEGKYFSDTQSAEIFNHELIYLMLYQMMLPNSPVLFNLGWKGRAASVSACYLTAIEDSMESILDHYKVEGMIFKSGAGSGSNLSTLRSSRENLSGGGKSSGVVSFMKALDANAGSIRSGGACLAPWQRVYTAKGPILVKDLAESGEKFIVLSYDPPARRYKAKWASAWLAGKKKVVRVTTDKGQFDLSEDHPIKLSYGVFCPAGFLVPGLSLFQCCIDSVPGYLRVHLRSGNKDKRQWHQMIAEDALGWKVKGNHVHHRDLNPFNNDPNNLELLSHSEHAYWHSKKQVEEKTHIFTRQKFSHAGEANGMHSNGSFYNNEEKVKIFKEKQSKILRQSGRSRDMQKKSVRFMMMNKAYQAMCLTGNQMETFEEYRKARIAIAPKGKIESHKTLLRKINNHFGSYDNFRKSLAENNHRVKSIEVLGEMDVYDIEVECPTLDDKSPNTGHNFVIWNDDSLVGKGIVVANTRRAALLRCLNVDHPDIKEFIYCKVDAEKKAQALIQAGFDPNFNVPYGSYDSIHFQNANHSVSVTDAFMRAVENDENWDLKAVTTGETLETVKAKDLFRNIAEAAHRCADPGIMFYDTINKWNGVKNSGSFKMSNPCLEIHMLDWTSCNLACLNLLRFLKENNSFDAKAFRQAIELTVSMQDIGISGADFPTEKITQVSRDFRPIGLGYTNLGALLMAKGLAYDSDEGRDFAESITALLTGTAFLQSAIIARQCNGAFAEYEDNKQHMFNKVEGYANFVDNLKNNELYDDIKSTWSLVHQIGMRSGFRNCEVTCAMPAGTVGLSMGSDTTGVEPAIALVAYKKLVGGGTMKFVNGIVDRGLESLGYHDLKIRSIIVEYTNEHGTPEGCPVFNNQHLPVFDCALPTGKSKRSISPEGHLRMLASVQKFMSQGVSKTINTPNETLVEDIEKIYMDAWKMGIKAVSVYRDGCKASQPLNVKKETSESTKEVTSSDTQVVTLQRRRLPDNRPATCHKFDIAGNEGYIHVGFYNDGTPGEVFIRMAKEGSTISGLMDTIATLTSMALQYGVPLETLVNKFRHVRFEPSGFTKNKDVPYAKSLTDYLFGYLQHLPNKTLQYTEEKPELLRVEVNKNSDMYSDGPSCTNCGALMIRSGACFICRECGSTSGCS